MTSDFRALCAELLDELGYQIDWSIVEELKSHARAALADEPAVPEGREPVSVVEQPKPVPVSERLPGLEDCDAEGRCWWWQPSHPESGYSEGWMRRPRAWGVGHYDVDDRLTHTHWIPAHALPVPEAG